MSEQALYGTPQWLNNNDNDDDDEEEEDNIIKHILIEGYVPRIPPRPSQEQSRVNGHELSQTYGIRRLLQSFQFSSWKTREA